MLSRKYKTTFDIKIQKESVLGTNDPLMLDILTH
ncbi:hypothetical protein EV213_113117 [Aureibacillus halotolerans]|uniref:Uncharacterized protein n=1 Tax=Aureibacillus halotolerans TaxID=1508390 RepID=A0A4R6TXH7_9BACI|nr:hypothetical protein EV213_113117 [Aureibacillus halotolerans]